MNNERITEKTTEEAAKLDAHSHKVQMEILNKFYTYNPEKGLLFENIMNGSEPVEKKFAERGVKRWHEYPRTVRIGSKYLDVTYTLSNMIFDNVNKNWVNAAKQNMLKYVSDSRSLMKDFLAVSVSPPSIFSVNAIDSKSNIVGYYYPVDTLMEGSCKLFLTFGNNGQITYDFWKKLTGRGDNIFFKCCFDFSEKNTSTDNLPEKEELIWWIIYDLLNKYMEMLSIEVADENDNLHTFSIEQAFKEAVGNSCIMEPFKEEKIRYDMQKAFLEYISSLVSRNLYDYLYSLDIRKLKIVKENPEYLSKNLLYADITKKTVDESFLQKVMLLPKNRLFDNSVKNRGRFHLFSTVDFTHGDFEKVCKDAIDDYNHHAEQILKELDEEDPLAKYEFSPVFQERILDEGYDGVGEKRYNDAMFSGFFKKKAELTDDEKYMLGNYSSRKYVTGIMSGGFL